jgi:hypothetical protein
MMVKAASFIHSEFDHFFGVWGEANFTKNNAISTSNHKLNGRPNLVQLNTEVTQNFSGDTLAFAHKAEQQVFCPDIVVLKAPGFFLSKVQDLPGLLGELVKAISVQ